MVLELELVQASSPLFLSFYDHVCWMNIHRNQQLAPLAPPQTHSSFAFSFYELLIFPRYELFAFFPSSF